MLDFHRLVGQFTDFSAYRHDEDSRHADRLDRALDAVRACAPEWETLRERVERDAGRGPNRALPLSEPDGCFGCGPRPATVTVVATDGSQIFPDRHVEPTCYLLNVACIAFQYGVEEPAYMVAQPELRYRALDLEELMPEDDAPGFDVSAEVVSALRDEQELLWLHRTAVGHRRSGRPLVAMADGTLIRWMIRQMKNRALETRLLSRYLDVLDRFLEDGIPVCSYVSKPASAEVVHLLRFHLGEPEDGPQPDDTLRGLLDRHLFERTLAVGERSAIFRSSSKIQSDYAKLGHDIHFFYVRLPGEVGRVELPKWVAAQPDWVELIHAVVLDQAEKGGGYPIALTEAHERAVIRTPEKELFYRMLERQVAGTGAVRSAKAFSKRAPRV